MRLQNECTLVQLYKHTPTDLGYTNYIFQKTDTGTHLQYRLDISLHQYTTAFVALCCWQQATSAHN